MPDIDVAAATEALNDAGGVESLMQQEQRAVYGEQTDTTQTPVTPEQAQVAVSTPAQQRDPRTGQWQSVPGQVPTPAEVAAVENTQTDAFTGLDPSSIPAELQPFYKSMQGDYTRKTQELATQRQQLEQLGPLDSINEAVSIYQQLQDPQAWPALVEELNQGLQALGMSPAEAQAQATETVQQVAAAPDLSALDGDPELAPVKAAYEQLNKQLTDLQSNFDAEKQRQQQEQQYMAMVGEWQRQENIIRAGNTDYTDDDIKAIYQLAPSTDGNLLRAQQTYDQMWQSRLSRYVDSKQGAAANITTLPGAEVVTPSAAHRPATLDEGHRMAMEALRQIEAQS